MLRSLVVPFLLSLAVVTIDPSPSRAADLRRLEGSWARYNVEFDPNELPRIDTLILSAPRLVTTSRGDALWLQLDARWQGSRVFALMMLVSDVAFLDGGDAPGIVHRYILLPANGDPIEYVDRATGDAYLPRFGLFDGLFPHARAGSSHPLFELADFLGRGLALDRATQSGTRMLSDLSNNTVLELDDRVLIGSSRNFRDDGTGPVIDYAHFPPRVGDYKYVPLTGADYDEMIESGFNLFRLSADQLEHVLDRPVFFMLHEGTAAIQDLFYRSNYRGGVMYMDEPDYRVSRLDSFEQIVEPEAAAQAVVDFTADLLGGSTNYGSRYLATMLAQENWALGPRVDLTEPSIPSWVAYPGTSWYQMEAGARCVIGECRVDPVEYSESVQDRLGVDFPAEPAPWIRFELGLATGSVQRFGGEWGVSVFGHTDDATADLLFPMAYERGARYFWVWTSHEHHHVPHDRQLEIVRNFRDWLANESGFRPRESRPLVAIALPWGYNCDRSNFKGDPGYLWWRTQIRLEDLNSEGVEYGEVLASFYRTYLERIGAGEEVDLIYLRADEVFENEIYDEVYRILPTGAVHSGSTSSPFVTTASGLPMTARPNPFVEGTSLQFEVPADAVAGVHVYDAAGRLVRTVLPPTPLERGGYTFRWNGRGDDGLPVSSGVYFVRAVAGDTKGTKTIVLLR